MSGAGQAEIESLVAENNALREANSVLSAANESLHIENQDLRYTRKALFQLLKDVGGFHDD